jgi:hypothetical protein
MGFETQSLRSQALYLFIKRVNFLIMLRGLGLLRVCLTQFVESFLNGELRGFGHGKISYSRNLARGKPRLPSSLAAPVGFRSLVCITIAARNRANAASDVVVDIVRQICQRDAQ